MDNAKKEAAISIFKSGLSNVPFIGQLLTEVLFEYTGRMKQQRLNNFIEIMKKSLENSNPYFDLEKIQSEDFADLFENVLRKVSYTKSKEKLIGFKNILFRGGKDNCQINRCEIFAELLAQVSSKHIEILKAHRDILIKSNLSVSHGKVRELSDEHYKVQEEIKHEMLFDYPDEMNPVLALQEKKEKIIEEIDKIEKSLKASKPIRQHCYYQLSKGDFLFYLQDLSSKALLMDEGTGGIGTHPFEIMVITELGLNFLNFIAEQ